MHCHFSKYVARGHSKNACHWRGGGRGEGPTMSPNDTWGLEVVNQNVAFCPFLNYISIYWSNENCHVTPDNVTKCHMGPKLNQKSVTYYLNGPSVKHFLPTQLYAIFASLVRKTHSLTQKNA